MLKFLIQKKLIFILLLLSLFLSFTFSFKADWFKKSALLLNLIQKLNKTYQALALEEYLPYFFPHFPQRLTFILSEAGNLIEDLVKLDEELKNELEKSNCQFALSQCLPKITFGGNLSCYQGMTLGQPHRGNLEKIEKTKEEIADRINKLSYLRELLIEEEKSGLPQELKTLRKEVADELNDNLNKVLEEIENIISVVKENQKLYSQDYTEKCTASCKSGPVCGLKACMGSGIGPQKNININAKLEIGLDDLELGEVVIDKFGLALPDKLKFPQLGDIHFTIPAQTLSICSSFGLVQPVTISAEPPSLAALPTLDFSCPILPGEPNLLPLSIPKLPHQIIIPFPENPPAGKWCPAVSQTFSSGELKITREEELNQFREKINKAIKTIESQLTTTSGSDGKTLKENRKELEEEYKEVEKEISQREEAPPVEFKTGQTPKNYEYQSPQNKELESKNIPLFYQCGQTSGDEKINTKAGTNWYFKTLSWLMENCANLPTMSKQWDPKKEEKVLKKKAADCYDPTKVLETINKECDNLWKNSCPSSSTLPIICKEIKHDCHPKPLYVKPYKIYSEYTRQYDVLDGDIAAAIQCQNLFKQKGLRTPSQCNFIPAKLNYYYYYYRYYYYSCPNSDYPTLKDNLCLPNDFNPLLTLKNKCDELKNEDPSDPPEPCKILPLLTKRIEEPIPETYFGSQTSCPAQTLLNLPFGFGSGFGFNCSIGLPTTPKIVLPDIIIPDIILPTFRIPPFLEVKLPSIIIEDLILPDVDLCDLNNCANLFPYLSFRLPHLRFPSIDLSISLPNLPALDLITRIDFPEINFSLPQINLFNLLLPELNLPEIPIPSPKINFAITGVDVGAIFDLIFSFILNALDVPDFDFCLNFEFPEPSLSIIFPDYYFSFLKFPTIPKIPFCQDINQFCQNVKNTLGNKSWLEKAKEIEMVFNDTINKIQIELDKVSQAVEDVKSVINKVFEETYGKIIYDSIVEQLERKGLSLNDYINPETKEIDLNKIPFPGIFPVELTDKEGGKIGECLPVSTPQVDIILKIGNYQNENVEKISPTNKYIIYVPVNIPSEIPIPWPKNLKTIDLFYPLNYNLPKIPLSDLNYEKEFSIKGPGFQPRTFSFNFGATNEGDCLANPATGGNPIPINKMNEIKNFQKEFNNASQKIIERLK